jgi:carbon-monoxide dehydrogenase small subunit
LPRGGSDQKNVALKCDANQRGKLYLLEGEDTVKKTITVIANGEQHTDEVEPRLLLVHYLRDDLRLTGTHVGCETSLCGACTVMLNGQAVKSCTVLAVQADGGEILTVEGLEKDEKLHPLQDGFWEEHGLQCGFCTPGMLMTSYQLLQRNSNPTEEQIRHGLEGNLCRCTGYQHIVKAVQHAAKKGLGVGFPCPIPNP